jgi:hypothetical protein
MSAWSCGHSHEYSRLEVLADGHDDPPLSIGRSGQSARNDSVPFVRGGRAPVEAVQGNRLCGREDLSEGEADGLVEAERHAAGVGPLELLIAQGRLCLVEALLAVGRLEGSHGASVWPSRTCAAVFGTSADVTDSREWRKVAGPGYA